jgi:uroporphyrinogen-III synthase
MASRLASADPLTEVFAQVVEFAASLVSCDSCFLYALEDGELILRASKNAHSDVVDRLKLRLGQGITGWVAEHRQPVAVALNAPRTAISTAQVCPKIASGIVGSRVCRGARWA